MRSLNTKIVQKNSFTLKMKNLMKIKIQQKIKRVSYLILSGTSKASNSILFGKKESQLRRKESSVCMTLY